jgi:CheY-like chemotaxis protein
MSKVLIVEDQPAMAAMVRHHVESAGFEVVSAGDVDTAWDLLVTESPDVGIVDIQLPGKEGWDLLTRTRVDERTREVPMLVLTGLHGREIRERAEAFGAEFFTKPFAASALVNRLHQIVHVQPEGPIVEEPVIPDTVEALTEITVSPTHLDRTLLIEELASIAPPPPAHDVEREAVPVEPSPSGADGPLDLVAVKVVLLLANYQVEGCLHMPAQMGRFSDAWESMFSAPRGFVAVTDAKVIVQGGPKAVAVTPFLQVRKSDIKGIFPTEQ